MRVEVISPLNSSILSSMLYEGLLFIRSECGDDADLDCLKELWDKKKDVHFDFVGNDKKYIDFIKNAKSFNDFAKYMKSIIPQDLNIYVSVNPKLQRVFVGSKSFVESGRKSYSLQIMKVDRYMGITSTELGITNKEVTVYADLNGIYLFFLGLISAYLTSIRGKGVNDYYFLFFDTGVLPFILRNPKNWMVIKENIANELKDVLNKLKSVVDEIITLSVLLNSFAVKSIKEQNVRFTSLRLVKLSNEGNTYKVYNDMPLEIFVDQKIYMNEKVVETLQGVLKTLIDPASKFVNGVDQQGDGYHAYMALKYLYSYVMTGNSEYLEKCFREIHEADRINPEKGYLLWASKKLI
ncbi:MAG: hypothetical protein QW743_00025 [Candidatus Methanomethylicia archaeon]